MSQRAQDRGLLRRVIQAAMDREEKGYPPINSQLEAEYNGMSLSERVKRYTEITKNADYLIPQNDKLLMFRALTGIDSVPALAMGGYSARTAPNVGIYTRVVSRETKAAKHFRFFSFLINICLGIQIIVAAAVTSIGAASGPFKAVTAFGAINTIMAAVLTYLRGSGLPDRLKSYQNKWKSIREYIEQREREFCLVDCDLDVQEEILIVESMYQKIKSELESSKRSGGDSKSNQQPEDPRIRGSLPPPHHTVIGRRFPVTPARRPDVACCPHHQEEPISPIAVPAAAAAAAAAKETKA